MNRLESVARLADRLKQINSKADQARENNIGEDDNESHSPGSNALQDMARAKSDSSSTANSQHDDAAAPPVSVANATGVVFHREFECPVSYWRSGYKLPEGGKIHLDGSQFAFRGITGTKLCFRWETLQIEKASRMGGLVNDAFRIIAVDPAKTTKESPNEMGKAENKETYLFSTILKDRKLVYKKIEQAIAKAKKSPLKEPVETPEKKAPRFQLPPDSIIQKMTVIGKKKLKGVSLQDYYEVAWSEGEHCDKPPMYAPFLTSCGKNNVKVNPWEEGKFTGDWCQENYTHQRHVTFNFMKQTIGQTLVEVKHTQRCRRQTNDQCIVHMTLEMKGFPYADCFVVEVRHVASRFGEHDLNVEIGMYVRFVKSCMFEGKIRNNTGAETTKAQTDLMDRIVEGCKPYAIGEPGEPEDAEEEESDLLAQDSIPSCDTKVAQRSTEMSETARTALHMLIAVFAAFFRNYVQPYIPSEFLQAPEPSSVEEALQNVRQRILVLKDISLKSVSKENNAQVCNEIKAIEQSLDNIQRVTKSDP
ncbi:hypothetical protein HJC23_009061 [Cyclotella cryptica]|uniref:VASt domain-containing protein n=1 Tax=Cyclotella cryptica TaxID=29204 RepID=A0ABD3QYP5_9STRA|eukprot:CCRYP_000671-RA/>CCRYP_000671-RA protein AED:0.22 eAED:0.22 QI:164/1/1/1/1/1/2/188/532